MSPLRQLATTPLLARRVEPAPPPAARLPEPAPHPILRLQQTLGNRAVQRLLQGPEGEQEAAPGPAGVSPAVEAAAPETPAAPPLGHAPAPSGMAACPDAPPRKQLTVTCPSSSTGPLVLPEPSSDRFGGDPDRARFARELAQCRAARVVKEEIEKRYRADTEAAKKRATAEAKDETAAAIQAAAESPDLDPKDKRAVSRAKARAAAAAKTAAAQKIKDAVQAVTRQDPAVVEAELANLYEEGYAADFAVTLQAALARYGGAWRNTAQARLDKARARITKAKRAKPKVRRGETPPAPKPPEQITAEIEAEVAAERCKQEEWLLNRLEAVGFGWAVGRREQLDFLTVPQAAAGLKGFNPTYWVAAADLVDIPAPLRDQEKKMPGVAPELADFLRRLDADPATPTFRAGNYAGHGGGSFDSRGFSVDLSLTTALDRRGFWDPATSVTFLLAVDRTAKAMGARWRVLYDDFVVAQQVNRATGVRNVVFQGTVSNGRLNWHGPDPLILHFHLDLEIDQAVPVGAVCEPEVDGGVCEPEP